MTSSELRKLQRMLKQAFGTTAIGRALFKWERTSNLHYIIPSTGSILDAAVLMPNGLYAVKTRHERHSWAKRMGNVWCIAHWVRPKCDYDAWVKQYGTAFVYPANGYYRPVEGTQLAPDADPDVTVTEMAIRAAQEQMGKSYDDFLVELSIAAMKDKTEMERMADDLVDDALTTFGQVPGEKGNVSYPSVATPTSKRF